jgi:hypothetical protein
MFSVAKLWTSEEAQTGPCGGWRGPVVPDEDDSDSTPRAARSGRRRRLAAFKGCRTPADVGRRRGMKQWKTLSRRQLFSAGGQYFYHTKCSSSSPDGSRVPTSHRRWLYATQSRRLLFCGAEGRSVMRSLCQATRVLTHVSAPDWRTLRKPSRSRTCPTHWQYLPPSRGPT